MLVEDRDSTPRHPEHAWLQEDRRDLIELCMDAGQAMHDAVTDFSQITLADLEEYAEHYQKFLQDCAGQLEKKIEACRSRFASGRPSRWENAMER